MLFESLTNDPLHLQQITQRPEHPSLIEDISHPTLGVVEKHKYCRLQQILDVNYIIAGHNSSDC
jgi:hypothetical protein